MISSLLSVIILLSGTALTSAVHVTQKNENYEQSSGDYAVVGHEYHEDGGMIVAAARDITTSCETKSISSFAFGPCEEKCVKYNPLSFSTENSKCAKTQKLGCVHAPCEDDDLAFSCQLNKILIEDITFVCPEDDIVFDGVNINTFDQITFRIDLNAPPAQTDVYLLADNTGSMTIAIPTAKTKAKEFFKLFGSREEVAFGVGSFKDEVELSNGFKHHQSITENDDAVINAIDQWVASGGGDKDEANLIALYKIATEDKIKWRQGSRRFIVLFGDVPGHEPSCTLGKPIDRNVVVDALKKERITVVMVNFGNLDSSPLLFRRSGCNGKTSAPLGQASFITKKTGGAIVSNSDQAKLVELIEEALRNVTRTYTVDESDCIDKLDAKHSPSLPLDLEPTQTAVVRNTVSLKKKSICDGPYKSFRCEYVYEEGGAAIKGGVGIQFLNIRGCDEFLAA